MDEAQQMDAGLIQKLFGLGLMGIEVPEEYGGAAERSSRRSWRWSDLGGRSLGRRACRCAEHAVHQCADALGDRGAEAKYLPRLARTRSGRMR
jgi:alkylation response protein AidB-like acyl-CoA dehydrogenase